jgi:uncharacterized membrane protein YbhN (UPF0104 family)
MNLPAASTDALPLPETPEPRGGPMRVLLFIVKYGIGFSLIAWMVWSGKLDLSVLGTMPLALVAAIMVLMVVQSALAALRVRYILAHQGLQVSVMQCVLFNCTGILYSAFLPGGISGDAVRAYLFMKAIPRHRLAILGAMFLDRMLGLLSMVGLGLAAAFYLALQAPVVRPYLLVFSAVFLVLVAGVGVLHFLGGRYRPHGAPRGRLSALWIRVSSAIAGLRIHHYPPRVLLVIVAQSILIHLTAVALLFICSLHTGAGLDFLRVFVVTPIGLLVNAIPLSPGGLGIGENAFEFLYRMAGGRNGATSFLIARVFLYSPALVGLGYVLRRMVSRKPR